jgi:D-alanine-D-alanine ligase-like ATP-grasp enzyme
MNSKEVDMNKPISVTVTAAKPHLDIRTLKGPNVFVPFAAVVAEFTVPTPITLPRVGTFPEVVCSQLPEAVVSRIQTLDRSVAFEMLVAGLAQALQDWRGPNNLPCQTGRALSGRGLAYLGYHDELATSYALRLGYELALVVFAEGQQPVDVNSGLVARVAQLGSVMQARQPDETDRAMIQEARTRGIPFYPVVPGQRMLQYGQGKYGRHFAYTSSQCDSHTGAVLQNNKVMSNLLVRRLGFPGVEHGVANTADNAVRLANQFGYPVVIKPVDGRQGQGVTAGATSGDEVAVAFAEANAVSPGAVIIERFVEGENVRLAVYCGRFAYATSRSPPRLVGDGKHTVTELIDLENQRRAETAAEGFSKKLKIDAAMIGILQKQNLQPNDCVSADQVVTLRSVANVSAGGTAVLATDRVHADNRRMAEAIARCFRLDTVGIDFLTADITKSWREVRCAVIEVNSAPTFSFADSQARLLLERAFPGTCTGRIPSVVVVCAEPTRVKEVVAVLQQEGVTVGLVERASTSLGGEPRAIEHVWLAERVQALLFDPACEALVVACTPEEIIKQGLPLDRCNLCVIESQMKLSEPLRRLLEQCSGQIIENTPTETALTRWLKDMT